MGVIRAGGRVSLQKKSRPVPSQEASAPSGGTSGARAALRVGRCAAPRQGFLADQGICDLFRRAVDDEELVHLFLGGLTVLVIVFVIGTQIGASSGHR